MNNEMIKAENLDEAFLLWYNKMRSNLKTSCSRDGDVVSEVLNAITVIKDPTRCIMKNKIRNLPMRYAIGELLWYMSGNNSLNAIRKYTKAWDRMSDDGITVNSNYGHCIRFKYDFDQWEYVKKELLKNRETRRAVIHIKTADDKESKDVNCTVYLQFFIRDNKLILHTHMRSNDLWMGFPYDVFQFTCMQIKMAMELDLEIGEYVHIADSLHFYERDYKKALENEKKIEG